MSVATAPPSVGFPRCSKNLSHVLFPIPRWTTTGACVGAFPVARRPPPIFGRIGVHDCTFEACSGFTRVTARAIAASPRKACVPAASACAGQVATESNRQLLGWIFHPLVLRALVAHQIFPIFSVVAPCRRGASPVSMRRQTFTTGC